jgi:hypothetical protein
MSPKRKRLDDLCVEFHAFRAEIKAAVKEVRAESATFKDLVNGVLDF